MLLQVTFYVIKHGEIEGETHLIALYMTVMELES